MSISKPTLNAFLAILLVAILLASCSPLMVPTTNQELPAPTVHSLPGPTATPEMVFIANDMRGSTITIWQALDGELSKNLVALLSKWELTNELGIKVQVRSFPNHQLMAEAIEHPKAGDASPDVILLLPQDANAWQDRLVSLDPYLSHSSEGIASEMWLDFLRPGTNGDNPILSLPLLRTTRVMVYNQTLAEQLGYSQPPSSLIELAKMACAANAQWKADKDPANDGFGGLALDTDANWQSPLAWMNANRGSGKVLDPALFNDPQNLATLSTLQKLREDGCAWLPDQGTEQEQFAARKAILFTADLSALQSLASTMAQAGNTDSWRAMPYPGDSPLLMTSGVNLAMMATESSKQKAGWLLTKWLLEPNQQADLADGVGIFPVNKEAMTMIADRTTASKDYRDVAKILLANQALDVAGLNGIELGMVSDGFFIMNRSYPYISPAQYLGSLDEQLHPNK